MEIDFSAICDIGRIREENQDSIYAQTGDGWGVFVVADGMGGHTEGAKASKTITDMLKAWIQSRVLNLAECEPSHVFTEIRKIMEMANEKIYYGAEKGAVCGSTAVVLVIIKDYYVLLSIGDSRCYELQKNIWNYSLHQMTHDEIVNEPGNKYGKLTNAVGTRMPLRCNIISGSLKKNIFFSCVQMECISFVMK